MKKNTVSHVFDIRQPFWWQGMSLATCYFIAAKLGLHFAVAANNITLIWPPSGLALFALLMLGIRFWPWILLGAFVTNVSTDLSIQSALIIACGNSLAAVTGFYLLRVSGFTRELHHVKDIMLLMILAASISTMVSATIGVTSLLYFQVITWNSFSHAWLSWWMGDAMGVLIFTPLFLSWRYNKHEKLSPSKIFEIILLLLSLALVTEFVFGNQLLLFNNSLPLGFMTFPILIWSAMRFGMRGATLAALIVFSITLMNIIYKQGIFSQGSTFESLTLLWLYANFLAVTSMVIAASTNERLMAEQRLRHLSLHDPLTGLRNRFSLQDDIDAALHRTARHNSQCAVLFMDLDRFKTINDTLGHSVGDQLLISVGQRLNECMRKTDKVFRQGGDEFIILLEDIKESKHAGIVAKKINTILSKPLDVQGILLHTSISIGISLYPNDGSDAETLLKNSDAAMYRAKDLGRNNAAFYSSEMNAHAVKKMNMEAELRDALDENQFELHYQPQYESTGVAIKGCEALLRWRKSSTELVSPDDFIPLLEENGLIKPVGAWVIKEACSQLASWHSQGWDTLRMAVNVSSQQLDDPMLLSHVYDCLQQNNLKPEWLELEITESMLVCHDDATMKTLKGLVDMGLSLAVDDFGTGYSSLSYLHRMSIDTLKIDRAFVTNIPGDEDSEAIIRAIVGLGKSIRLTLVAEGIETHAQAKFLRKLGCDLLQGYLFSRPIDANAFQQLLIENSLPMASGKEKR